jgi:hypothetical protein
MPPITVEVRKVATHPEDDVVLATALSADAEYLATGDRKLQVLGSYRTVTILPPRAFVDLLNPEDMEPQRTLGADIDRFRYDSRHGASGRLRPIFHVQQFCQLLQTLLRDGGQIQQIGE